MLTTLRIETQGPGLYECTDAVNAALGLSGSEDGLLTLFVQHTSCSLLIQENADPEVQSDLTAFFKRLVPDGDDPSMGWMRHAAEGPDDMPAHIKAALTQTSIGVPFQDRRLMLGAWQGIYLFEHRRRPQTRRVIVHVASDRQSVA